MCRPLSFVRCLLPGRRGHDGIDSDCCKTRNCRYEFLLHNRSAFVSATAAWRRKYDSDTFEYMVGCFFLCRLVGAGTTKPSQLYVSVLIVENEMVLLRSGVSS